MDYTNEFIEFVKRSEDVEFNEIKKYFLTDIISLTFSLDEIILKIKIDPQLWALTTEWNKEWTKAVFDFLEFKNKEGRSSSFHLIYE